MNPKISCVMCARNEQKYLSEVLTALKNQSLPLYEIVLVNDGSTDKTVNIARSFGAHIINLPYHNGSVAGTPRLAQRFNMSLKEVSSLADYVLIVGSDDVLPSHYIETLLERMEENPRLVVASGQVKDEPSNPLAPRGAGRLVKTWFWRKISGLQFPLLWCWEEYLVYRALQLGYEVHGFEDVLFERKRLGKRTKKKLMGDGKAMYALGYSWQIMIAAFIRDVVKSPRKAVYTFCGWLTGYVDRLDRADDVAVWINMKQNRRLHEVVLEMMVSPSQKVRELKQNAMR